MSERIYSIDELKQILAKILSKFQVKKAILFGSYAKHTPTEKSDIDLVIDSEGKLLNINFYGLLEEIQENSAKGNETECLKLTAQKEILLELEKRLFN